MIEEDLHIKLLDPSKDCGGSKASLDQWQGIDLFTGVAFGPQEVEILTTDVPRLSLTHPSSRGGTKK